MEDTTTNSNILEVLNCAIGTKANSHLCEIPIILSCGHYICRKCLRTKANYNTVKCNICNELNRRDLNQEAKPQLFNMMLDTNIKLLFKLTFDRFKLNLTSWIQTINETDERVEKHVEFLREEIQIQIESMKTKLDDLFDSLNKELEELKAKWKLDLNYFNLNKIDVDFYKSELERLEDSINKQQNLTSDNLYYYENKLVELQKVLHEYNDATPKLKFIESNCDLNKESIGRLLLETDVACDNQLIAKIKENKCDGFYVSSRVDDFCILSNGNLLVTNYDQSSLNVYDKKFNLIKTIDSINGGKKFGIMGVACNENEIFLSDFKNSFVYKTDFEFNELATFGNGIGCSTSQINSPFGLCYFDLHLYVCDYRNKRIIKLDKNLNFVASHAISFKPCYIKAINRIAIVRQFDETSIFFYNLNNFNLIRKYAGHNGIIGVSHLYFYEYYQPTKTFYCYDKNGDFVDEIETNGFGLATTNFNGAIFIYRSKLYLAHRGDLLINVFAT